MFRVDLPTVAYSNPWDLPLTERVKRLARGKRRVAYYYESANNSTFRYRAYNMVNVLNNIENNHISASYFFLTDLHRIDDIVNHADLLVICRSGYNHHLSQLIARFKAKRKRVLFDIDDLVFDVSYAHLIINTLDQDTDKAEIWDYWFAYIGRMGEALRQCDGAITTNHYLAAKITEFSGLPTKVIPNFINQEQLDMSEAVFHAKISSSFERDEKICLGYFSGSPSHNLDYALVTPALEEVLENDPRVEVMIVGYIEAGSVLSKFGPRIKYQNFRDYINLQQLVGTVEFNLMPLQMNDFTQCKSELKYFEAAIVGTLSIASPSYTYAAAINNGKNGYIAQAHQWGTVIRNAVDNLANYNDMAIMAYNDARIKYSWLNQRDTIFEALEM